MQRRQRYIEQRDLITENALMHCTNEILNHALLLLRKEREPLTRVLLDLKIYFGKQLAFLRVFYYAYSTACRENALKSKVLHCT